MRPQVHVHFHEADHPRVASGAHGGEFTAGGAGGKPSPAAQPKPTKVMTTWTKAGGGGFTEAEVARLKALRVPPGWTNVHLNPDTNAPTQVVAKDTKGRTVYKRSAAATGAASAAKFARLKAFNAVAPAIAQKAIKDMGNPKLSPKERDAAAVVALISASGLRIGSEADTGADVQAYGATTLTKTHAKAHGSSLHLDFIGKKGVHITKTVEGVPELVKYLRAKPDLLSDQKLFSVSDAAVREYFHKKTGGEGFKVKDFRTWNGTNVALKAIAALPAPDTPEALKKAKLAVAKQVSDHLGNTPAVALEYYIDPAVFSAWEMPAPASKKVH